MRGDQGGFDLYPDSTFLLDDETEFLGKEINVFTGAI